MHAATGGGGRRILLGEEREGSKRKGRETSLRSESLHQKRRAQTGAEETLVPQRSEMEDRMRRADQRAQAAPRTESQPVQGRRRDEAMGWAWDGGFIMHFLQ